MASDPGPATPADDGAEGADEAERLHRRRVRAGLRIVAVAALLGVVAALLAGTTTQDGRAALAFLLLVVTGGTVLAGLHTVLLLVVDELRGRPTSLRRGAWAAGWFVLTAALMASLSGIGG